MYAPMRLSIYLNMYIDIAPSCPPNQRIDREDYESRFKIDMEPVAKIERSTVFTIHGRADDTVPVEDASEWSGRIPKHHLHLINGGHYFIQPAENQEVLRLCQAALWKRVVFEPPPPANESTTV